MPPPTRCFEGDVKIRVVGCDTHISLMPGSNQWGLIYYCIEVKATFMKVIIINTSDDRVYTLTNFIYNPHIRFQHNSGIITIFKKKYDMQLPVKVIFILVYPLDKWDEIRQYMRWYPIPSEMILAESLRAVGEKVYLKHQLESKLGLLSEEIKSNSHHLGVDTKQL